MKTLQSLAPWIVFAGYAAAAAALSWQSTTISLETHPVGKAVSFAAFFGFLLYTVYCSIRENFFSSLGKLMKLHWGRQVGLDLYVGLLLHATLLYAMGVTGWMFFFWAAGFLVFGNTTTLLYLALHFDAISLVFAP